MWHVRGYYGRGLWRVPGPILRRIFTITRIISVYRGFSHEDDLELHRKYGPIVRTAPNQVSISDPREIKKIYGVGTRFVKSSFYSLSEAYDEEGLIPDPFILKDMKKHTYMKRNASNAYALHGLVKMEACIEPITTRLLGILHKYAESQEPAPMDQLLKNYTMDAITAITFGKDFDYLSNGDSLKLHRVGEIIASYMAIVSVQHLSHSSYGHTMSAKADSCSVRSDCIYAQVHISATSHSKMFTASRYRLRVYITDQ